MNSLVNPPQELLQKLQAIKLIFFDIDGTLLNAAGEWSNGLVSELIRLKAKGVKLAIASGRPSFAAQFIFDGLPILDAGVFCTGAELYDPRKQRHLKVFHLDKGHVHALYQRAKVLGLYCEFYTQEYHITESETDISQIHGQHLRANPRYQKGDDFLNTAIPIIKLLLGNNEKKTPGLLDQLASEFPVVEFAFAHFLARPDWKFASVISRNANKEIAFNTLLDYHDVMADEVMSLGDSYSDETFITLAGVGVAMPNAPKTVQQKANIVTSPSDDGGIEKILQLIV